MGIIYWTKLKYWFCYDFHSNYVFITNVTTDITTMAAIPLLEKYDKLEVM